MPKNVLVLSASPRMRGNLDMLCDQFIKGAEAAYNIAEKIYVHHQVIGTCRACYVCKTAGTCVQKDDMPSILEKMIAADVIVLATPVYFYMMNGQLKILIDRTLSRYTEICNKEFYFIATAAEEKASMESTMDSLRGFTDCLPGATIKGLIYGSSVWQKGAIQGNKSMQEAMEMGMGV